jgi:hypothetical protein
MRCRHRQPSRHSCHHTERQSILSCPASAGLETPCCFGFRRRGTDLLPCSNVCYGSIAVSAHRLCTKCIPARRCGVENRCGRIGSCVSPIGMLIDNPSSRTRPRPFLACAARPVFALPSLRWNTFRTDPNSCPMYLKKMSFDTRKAVAAWE